VLLPFTSSRRAPKTARLIEIEGFSREESKFSCARAGTFDFFLLSPNETLLPLVHSPPTTFLYAGERFSPPLLTVNFILDATVDPFP